MEKVLNVPIGGPLRSPPPHGLNRVHCTATSNDLFLGIKITPNIVPLLPGVNLTPLFRGNVNPFLCVYSIALLCFSIKRKPLTFYHLRTQTYFRLSFLSATGQTFYDWIIHLNIPIRSYATCF